MERSYRTWQGRLPQELRVRGIATREAANVFLGEEYVREFNRRFTVLPALRGSAFVRTRRKDVDWVFALQYERTGNQDNTIALDKSHFPDREVAVAKYAGWLGGAARSSALCAGATASASSEETQAPAAARS